VAGRFSHGAVGFAHEQRQLACHGPDLGVLTHQSCECGVASPFEGGNVGFEQQAPHAVIDHQA
jgi:hypothetical protein